MSKKKILIATDSPAITTGFSEVGREITKTLLATGKYDISTIAWFHPFNREKNEHVQINYPCPLYFTQPGDQSDNYCHKSAEAIVREVMPDYILTIADQWMSDWVPSVRDISGAKWCAYFPIDGLPFPSQWKHITRLMDVPVTFTEFGRNAIREKDPFINPLVINHGVDVSAFKRYSAEEIFKFKQSVMPGMENKFIVGTGGRNQPRKNYPAVFEGFAKFCKDKPNVYLYIHAAEKDAGWDLADLANRYGVKKRVIIPNIQACLGIPKERLGMAMNCWDIGIFPYAREGWGLFGSQSLACGVPVLFTNSGPMPEYAAGCGEAINVKNFVTSTHYNLDDAYVDVDDMVYKMNRLYYNPDLRFQYGQAGLERAKQLDWSVVNQKWVEIFAALDERKL